MPRIKNNVLYECPRCGMQSIDLAGIRRHFNNKRPCAANVRSILLTEEIKQIVMRDRIYRFESEREILNNDKEFENSRPNENQQDQIKQSDDFNYYIKRLKTPECIYQQILEKVLGASHNKLCNNSVVTDLTNEQFHAEIKCWDSWMKSLGQLFAYNHISPRSELRVYLFGRKPKNADTAIACFVANNIAPYHIELSDSGRFTIINLVNNEIVYNVVY